MLTIFGFPVWMLPGVFFLVMLATAAWKNRNRKK